MAHGPIGSSIRSSKPQPASAELRERLVEIGDPVQQHGRIATEVIGEDQPRAVGADRDLDHPGAHRLDGEDDTRPEHVPVEGEVGLDVATCQVEHIERLDRHDPDLPSPRRPRGHGSP